MFIETAVLETHLGLSLRRWRVLNRIKQHALAKDLDVSQSKISRWESGKAEPDGPDRLQLIQLLRAKPETSADRALLELVSRASVPTHLVCDLTHRLLAVSPQRAQDWHVPAADLMGLSLWKFASQAIQTAETQLADHGWYEPHGPDVRYFTERADFPELTIPESHIRISRLPLSDGRFARLVRNDDRGRAA